jgi:hypothetical protein
MRKRVANDPQPDDEPDPDELVTVDATGNYPNKSDTLGNESAPLGADGSGGQIGWYPSVTPTLISTVDGNSNPANVYEFTIACWMKRGVSAGSSFLQVRAEDDDWGRIFRLRANAGGDVEALMSNQGDDVVLATADADTYLPADDDWHLVAAGIHSWVFDVGSSSDVNPEVVLSIDGSAVGTSSTRLDAPALTGDAPLSDWRVFGGVVTADGSRTRAIGYWKSYAIADMASLYAAGPPASATPTSSDPAIAAMISAGVEAVLVPQ